MRLDIRNIIIARDVCGAGIHTDNCMFLQYADGKLTLLQIVTKMPVCLHLIIELLSHVE